jgi:hypothetical protein
MTMRNSGFLTRALLCLPALFLLTSCAKKGVDLKFNYQAGQTSRYHLTSEVKTRTTTNSNSNNYAISIDLEVNYTVMKILDKGDAELQFTYDKIRYLNTQNPSQTDSIIRQLRDLKITLTLSPCGEISDVKGYENIPKVYIDDVNIFSILMKALPVFPRTPIEVGRKWEREQEFPIENGLIKGNMLVYKRFSLLDTASVDGATIVRIGTEINMKFDVPRTESFSLEQDGNERLGLFGTGTIRFDATRGEAVEAKAAIFGKMLVAIKHPVSGNRITTRIEVVQNISVSRI